MHQTFLHVRRWLRTWGYGRPAPPLFNAPTAQVSSAAALLHIPTSDGSGEACHPSTVYIPGGFGGYQFWMANAPYPENTHKLENPELFASKDGIFWEVPPGVVNPLVGPPAGDDRRYNSDPCLVHHRDRLILFFRTSDEARRPRRDWLSMMISRNGRDWSEPRIVLDDSSGRLLLSPTVRHINGEFVMWTVERTDGPSLTICRRMSVDGEHWSSPQPTELVWRQHPLEPWHIDIVACGKQLLLVFSGRDPRRRGSQLFYAATGDGIKWTVHGCLNPQPCPFEAGKAYKPSLVVMDEKSSRLRLYASSTCRGGRWYMSLRPYSITLQSKLDSRGNGARLLHLEIAALTDG